MYGKSYWTEHLGEGWVEVLKPLLKDPYMEKLMNFLMVQYALEEVHPEDYKSLFKAFKYVLGKSLEWLLSAPNLVP